MAVVAADNGVTGELKTLNEKITAMQVQLGELNTRMVSRTEIEAMDARRVSMDAYLGDRQATNERLTRLESGPQRMLGWIGAAFGAVGCLASALSALALVAGALWFLAQRVP